MNHDPAHRASRRMALVGGASLLVATLLFGAVFAYLARTFDYPAVLDLPAAQVLPRLLALGDAGRAVWVVYALVPLLLLPTALGVQAVAGTRAPLVGRVALLAAVLSAACMSAGLLRWPALHWPLAQAWASAGPAAREALAAFVAGSNTYLGRFVGEFLGELFLNTAFMAASWVLAPAAGLRRRAWAIATALAALSGGLAMLRNLTPLVESIAAVNNLVLPLWMLLLAAALLRNGGPVAAPRQAAGHLPA